METARNVIKANIEQGRDFKEAFDDCVEMGLCLSEDEEQLREQFEPLIVIEDETEQFLEKPNSFEKADSPHATQPTHLPVEKRTVMPERSAPVLLIDWGREIQPNVILSPVFTIQGGQLECQPLVYFPLDKRIEQKGWQWNEMPTLKRASNGWSFHQQLQLEKAGQYLFHVIVIDPQPGYSDPAYYHAVFRMDVGDGQRRKITIQADGNLLANLDRFGKDADIEIVGSNVTLMARDESIVDKLATTTKNTELDCEMTTVPFQSEPDHAQRVPYVSHPNAPKQIRLYMLESVGQKCYTLIGGRRLEFGRDVPEQNVRNDVPLEIQPGTHEEYEHADEFAILNGLFSREHARLEVSQKSGVYLVDARHGGIQEATILDDQPLCKMEEKLMFPNDADPSITPRNVLFSKILSMKFIPHYEKLQEEAYKKNLPNEFPMEWLNVLYLLEYSTGISSICVTPDQHFKQKDHSDTLMKILQKKQNIAESDWWRRWFKKTNSADPRYGTHEYWFIPRFITLGRDNRSAIRLESRRWSDVRLRIIYIKNSLYVENISPDADVEFGVGMDCRSLPPFRPVPLCSGAFVRKSDAMLRFE